jgi:hypothetical protein
MGHRWKALERALQAVQVRASEVRVIVSSCPRRGAPRARALVRIVRLLTHAPPTPPARVQVPRR